MDLQDEARWIS